MINNTSHKIFSFIHKNGLFTFSILAIISYCLSTVGFYLFQEKLEINFQIFVDAFLLSFSSIPSKASLTIIVGKLFWMFTFASAGYSLFLKEWSYKEVFKSILEKEHTVIIGVGVLSHNYINQLDKNKTVIFNINKKVSNDSFKNNNFAIKDLEIEELNSNLNIKKMQKVLINSGNDINNINIAFNIIQSYLTNELTHKIRIIIRIDNKELNSLFLLNKFEDNEKFKQSKIELKTYSFFEECAINLFQKYSIDGDDDSIINSSKQYSLAIIGNGDLANKIVYEASKIAHLPNENILNIYLLNKEANKFKKSLIKEYINIELIPTLKIHEINLDYEEMEFYENEIWDKRNLTNVIICYDDESINLEIASAIKERVYLKKQNVKTKVLIALFNQENLSYNLSVDDNSFGIFKSFGNAKEILSAENIIEDKDYILAKLINYTYELLRSKDNFTPYDSDVVFNYRKNCNSIDFYWFKTVYTDKISSLAQAKHINIKLKALGFKIKKVSDNLEELLKHNREIFDSRINTTYEGNYKFPESFDMNIFNKLIRCEHNRWNAFHYLNGWEYNKEKNKRIKNHNCLLQLKDFSNYFDDKKMSQLIEWDIYSFMYIPNYLAEIGYKLDKY